MKAIFNEDGSMFLVQPDSAPMSEEFSLRAVWFPDDLDFRKDYVDENGVKGSREVTNTELKKRVDEYMSDYYNARKLAYPSLEEQLDTLYHEGYDGWGAQITAVKLAYPKPE